MEPDRPRTDQTTPASKPDIDIRRARLIFAPLTFAGSVALWALGYHLADHSKFGIATGGLRAGFCFALSTFFTTLFVIIIAKRKTSIATHIVLVALGVIMIVWLELMMPFLWVVVTGR